MLVNGTAADTQTLPPASLSLVEEINHRVINEYAEAIAMLSIAAARADQGVRATLSSVAERLRDHADAHRALLPPMTEGYANLADHVAAICGSYARATLADRAIHLILKADDILLSADRGWRVGLIVAELVRNATRHGLKGKAGLIDVRVTRQGDRIICLVSDSGRAEPGRSPGRGQRLVRALVTELGGAVRWSFTPTGSFALVHIPVTEGSSLVEVATICSASDSYAAQ